MAFRHVLRCFVCDNQFNPRNMVHIYGDNNADRREIAIRRREDFGRTPLDVTPETRICFNCNVNIQREINEVQANPSVLRVNVLSQTRSSSCCICHAEEDIHRLTIESKIQVFIQCNIVMQENVRSCATHLDRRGFILRPLLDGLQFVNRPYVMRGEYLAAFLQGLRGVAQNRMRFCDEDQLTDEEFRCITSLTKVQFDDLFSFCDPVPREGGFRYVRRIDLLAFLFKMRQGLSDDFLAVMCDYGTRQAASLAIATVRRSLMVRFVPNNIGFGCITRDQFIERHVTDFANRLYNDDPTVRRAIIFPDGTYSYIFKSSNFRTLRQSYSLHKGRHLLKPAVIVAPDGYILCIQNPYFSDARNNDAAMLRDELEDVERMMGQWLQEGDIVIVDRGYRDVIPLLEEMGLTWKMPSLLRAGERQMTTEDANESRKITKSRWIVEARNGHIKSIFQFLNQVMQIQHCPNLGDFYQIAGALLNRYHPLIHMRDADALLAERMIQRATEPNILQERVERERLAARDGRWVRLDADELRDFPVLTIEYLEDLTFGVYQVGLAPSYVQDKLEREADEEFQVEMLRGNHPRVNILPEPGLLRVRLHSRFRNRTRYQLWVSYTPVGDANRNNGVQDADAEPIRGYYCMCKSGARTLGMCAHVTSVLWYLGYARHEEDVSYPSQILLDTVRDAGNRPRQVNP